MQNNISDTNKNVAENQEEQYATFVLSDSQQYKTLSHYTESTTQIFAATKKKYKPVAQKVRAVITQVNDKFRIERKRIRDPMATLPPLNIKPPPFTPTGRYTKEQKELTDQNHPGDFLLSVERE